jgi:hypothetical protein
VARLVTDLSRRIRLLNERDPYAEVVGSIAAMNPSKQFGEATVRLYVAALRDVPIDELRERVWELIKTRTFPPTIAEVLQYVAERRANLPGVAEAWELVVDTIAAREGWNDLPEPVRRAADNVGGPFAIKTTNNTDTLRAHFYNAYREFREAAVAETVLALDKPNRRAVTSGV